MRLRIDKGSRPVNHILAVAAVIHISYESCIFLIELKFSVYIP